MRSGASAVDRPWYKFNEGGTAFWEPSYPDALTVFRAAVSSGRGGVTYFGRRWTFAELDAASESLRCWAAERGVGHGDRISIILQNVPAFAIGVIAAWKLGAVPVPGNPGYRSAELARVFADSRPSLIICHPEHQPEIRHALDAASIAPRILLVSAREHGDSLDSRVVPLVLHAPESHQWLSDILVLAATSRSGIQLSPSDIGLLLYTSGTTGEPKGAMLQHSSLVSNAELMGEWCGVGTHSRILGLAPMFHITGFVCNLLMAITQQCWLILHYRFEAATVLDVIRRERPTYAVGAITAFNALAAVPTATPADFESFEEIYSGGAPIAPALQRSLKERLGVEIRNCYGMTETCAPTHLTPRGFSGPVDSISGALSIGIPQWGTDAKIVADDGQELPVGEVGELWVSGPQVMMGYWNKPEDTAAALTDGWLHTGDVGFMDRDGWFYLVDRKKDMINASGFKVWPREVEDALYQHPSVREAAVVGEPDEYRGETVIAYVSLRDGAKVDPGALIAHCRGVLAAYKCPREVRQISELPKTVTGKILRRALRRGGVAK